MMYNIRCMNIAISNVSLLPYSINPNWTLDLIRSLEIGLQLVPVWGAHELVMKASQAEVISLEPAWSHEPLFPRFFKDPIGASMNFGFFGTSSRSKELEDILRKKFPNSIHIDFPDSNVREIAFRKNIFERIHDFDNMPVVFDSWHIRELEPKTPIKSLEMILEHVQVSALHLQTRSIDELSELIEKGAGYLANFLKTFGHLNVPIVIELAPQHLLCKPREKIKVVVKRIQDLTA